jgi:hypothetical protein
MTDTKAASQNTSLLSQTPTSPPPFYQLQWCTRNTIAVEEYEEMEKSDDDANDGEDGGRKVGECTPYNKIDCRLFKREPAF